MHRPQYDGGILRGDARPMSGLTSEQMLHDSPISMLNKNPSEIKNSTRGFLPRKGAAPEFSVIHEGPNNQSHDYDARYKNYFNNEGGNEDEL